MVPRNEVVTLDIDAGVEELGDGHPHALGGRRIHPLPEVCRHDAAVRAQRPDDRYQVGGGVLASRGHARQERELDARSQGDHRPQLLGAGHPDGMGHDQPSDAQVPGGIQ